MATPIEPIGADSEITIRARQQQQRAQQSYAVMQQRQQQQLQQQRRQEQIRKLQADAAARRQRAEGLIGYGAKAKGVIDAPKTPMLAERITGMRPRDGSAPRGESLAENVAAEEERRIVEFMRSEARRAVEEERSIAQAEAAWERLMLLQARHQSLQAMAQREAERQAALEEYKKYSEAYAEAARRTKVTYSDYLKAFKAGETTLGYDEWKQPYIQQELFKIQHPDLAEQIAELSNISQLMAQEGWGEAYAKYGDVAPRITKLQQAIQQEKGLSPEQVQTLNAWLSDVSAQNVAANRQFAAEKSARATLRKIQDAPTWQPKTPYEQAWFRSLDPGEQQLVAMSELPLLPVGASETFRTAYGEEGEEFVGRYTLQVLKGKELRAAKTAPPDLSNLPTGQTFSLVPFYEQTASPDPVSPLGAFTREHMPAWNPTFDLFVKGGFRVATLAAPALIASKQADIGADLFTAHVKGAYTGIREDPEVTIASLAIGAAIPGIGKGASFLGRAASSRIGAPEAVKQAIPKISKILGAGLLGAYGGSVAVRAGAPDEAGAFPSATLVSERLGRITSTEIAPAFIGGYGAQRGLDITIDYARTRGLPELDATALIPESVRTGRTQFPVEPPGRTPPEALAARFRRAGEPLGFHGTRAEGGFHATDAPFPPRATITLGRRPYEGGGLSIAPQISPHFLRVGSSYSAFGLDLFPASSRPTVMFMRPEAGVRVIPPDVPRSSMAPMAEFMLSPRAQRGAAYIAPKYEAGWRRAAMESEAMIPVGTITESVGPIGYVRWAGRRVPVEERIALSDAGTLRISPADITTAIPGISSSVLPKSSPVTSPATFAGIGGIPSSSRFEVSAPAVSITPSISTPRPARSSAPSQPSRPSQSVPIVPSVSIPDIIPSVPRSSPPRSPPPSSIYDIPKPPSSSYTPSPPPSSQITLSPPPSSPITPYRPPSSQITLSPPPSSQITLSPPPSSRPPFTPGLSEDQRRASFGDEFYLHAADLPTPHARLEEAYTNLRDPKIRPAKIIRNLQRVTIGRPLQTPRRARTVQTATVRKTPHRVPWDIPAVRPLDVVGVPGLVFGQKKKKKKSRRRR